MARATAAVFVGACACARARAGAVLRGELVDGKVVSKMGVQAFELRLIPNTAHARIAQPRGPAALVDESGVGRKQQGPPFGCVTVAKEQQQNKNRRARARAKCGHGRDAGGGWAMGRAVHG